MQGRAWGRAINGSSDSADRGDSAKSGRGGAGAGVGEIGGEAVGKVTKNPLYFEGAKDSAGRSL
jgi:hypothetical protein